MRFNFLVVFLVCIACKKQAHHSIAIIGHAGNGLDIPTSFYAPNSLESIEMALGTPGIEGVELDVQLSIDNELWLYHDDLLEISTNGKGCISNSTNEELKNVRYKTANQEKLTRLKDLNFELYTNKTIYLDLRHYNGCAESIIEQSLFIDGLTPLIDQWPAVKFIIVTNHKQWLNGFSQSGLRVYCDIETMSEFDQMKNGNFSYEGVIIRNSACTKDDVARIKHENKAVILFDLRAPKSIRKAFEKTPSAIITDDVKAALIEKS